MFTIKDAAGIFGQIDAVAEEDMPALDKALRNLSQRLYLPPADRQGRADVYTLASICALRLLSAASGLLSDRWILERLAREMQNESGGMARRIKLGGGELPMSPVEEAIERVREGQTFDFNLKLYADGHLGFEADWPADDTKCAAVVDAILSSAPTIEPKVTLVLHASRLIREILDTVN